MVQVHHEKFNFSNLSTLRKQKKVKYAILDGDMFLHIYTVKDPKSPILKCLFKEQTVRAIRGDNDNLFITEITGKVILKFPLKIAATLIFESAHITRTSHIYSSTWAN